MRPGRAAAAAVVAALVAGLIACAGPAGGTSSPAPSAAGRPRIVVEPEAFDFGTALPGKTLDRDVGVRNHGDAELVIARVETTCNCTVVGGYATRLAPGSGTTLRVSLTTPQSPGRTEQRVRIESNDPQLPVAYVDVAATVVAPRRGTR